MSIFFRCVLFVSTVIAVSNGYAEDIVTTHSGDYLSGQIDKQYKITGNLSESKIAPCQTFIATFDTKNVSDKPIQFIPDSVGVLSENIFFRVHPETKPPNDHSKIRLRSFTGKIMWFTALIRRQHQIPSGESKKYQFHNLNTLYDFTLDGEYTFFLKLPTGYNDTTDEDIFAISDNITINIDSSLVDLKKVIPANAPQIWSKPLHGLSISVVADKLRYEDYGAVYLRILSKNVSDSVLSTIIETKNVLDAYELTLLMPGGNLDFRKPATKDGSDVKKVDLTLFGKKLVSEKSKTAMPFVQIKPNEEAAEAVIVLNRIFDMSTDGIYGLIVTEKIKDQNDNEQTISTEPFPIRIGNRPTEEEREADRLRRRLEGNDPDYPIWQSRDGLFKVIAKLISVDKDIITLEKPDGKRTTFNISDLQPDNQKQIPKIIEEQKRQKEREEFEKQ